MYEGVEVIHKAWGSGTIVSIIDGHITVDFQDIQTTFVFPDSIGTFLQVTDSRLLEYVSKEKEIKKKKEEEKREEARKKIQENLKTKGATYGDDSDYETPLLGKKSGDILFPSDAEFYETIGYLAKPGRIAFYQAELTEDKETQFNRLFPNQDYRVIKISYGKGGMATKQGCQFRINLSNIADCPTTLSKHISEKNGHYAGRINRSKFALRLVQNNGFQFGYTQNISEIEKKVPDKYKTDFQRGLNL